MKKSLLAAYILYLPFQLKLPQIPAISTLNIFLILLCIIFITGRSHKAVRISFEAPLLIFLGLWAMSFVHALFYAGDFWRLELAVNFKRIIAPVIGYFVFSRCIKAEKELNFLFHILLFTTVLVGLYTLREGMLAGPHFADFKRSSGPFGEGWRGSDIAGGFLATFTPFLLAFTLLSKKKKFKLLTATGLIACVMGLFATYSRGSILALGVAAIITALVIMKQLLKTSRVTAGAILFVFLALAIKWQAWVPESVIHRAEETVQDNGGLYDAPEFDQSTQGRLDKWDVGVEIFKSSPLIGIGFKIPEYIMSYDTHNAYIQILAEMGIFAILVFLWFLWKVLREAGALLNTRFSVIGSGVVGCIIAFLLVNMFYSNFFRDTVVGTFWVMLGILSSAKRVSLETS